jgi:hypothetical protein
MTTARSKLSLEQIEQLMDQWQAIDDLPMSDADRDECIDAIKASDHSFEWWQSRLIRVPVDVESRYRKVVGMLLEKRLIDQAAHDYEVQVMNQFSPMELTVRGKQFAEWWRSG